MVAAPDLNRQMLHTEMMKSTDHTFIEDLSPGHVYKKINCLTWNL